MNKYQTLLREHIEPFPIQWTQKPMKIQNDMEKAMLVCCEAHGVTCAHLFKESGFLTEYAFTNELKK